MTTKNKKTIGNNNGHSTHPDQQERSSRIADIISYDTKITTEVLNRAETRINELEKRLNDTFTEAEKEAIKEKLDILRFNYKTLKEKHENPIKKTNNVDFAFELHIPPNLKDAILDLEDDIDSNSVVTEEMIDNDTRKVGTYGRSYDSGFKGYTKKEVAEIQKLIPDIHEPVFIESQEIKFKIKY